MSDENKVVKQTSRERLVVAIASDHIGCATAGTVKFAEWLAKVWEQLPDGAKRSIRRELREAFEADNLSRARLAEGKNDPMHSGFHPLGMNCDRDAWEKVARVAFTEEEISDE